MASGILLLLLLTWIPTGQAQTLGAYASHGCQVAPNITMTCPQPDDLPSARYIRVDNATYGQYDELDCITKCCDPTDVDCEEAVSISSQADWDAIVAACNMTQGSCTVTAIVDNLITCPSPGINNFQVVYYTCVLDDGSVPTTPTPTTPTPTTPTPSTTPTTAPPTPRPTVPPTSPPGSGPNVGAIIGGVLAGLFIVAIVIIVVLLCKRRQETKTAMKNTSSRPVVIRNGNSAAGAGPGRRGGETSVYDNPAFDNRTYADEEMIIGDGKQQQKKPRVLSKTPSQNSPSRQVQRAPSNVRPTPSSVYENIEAALKQALEDGSTPNGTAAHGATGMNKKTDTDRDNVSQSASTVYENVEVKANPNPYIEIAEDKAQNGSAGKFKKASGSSKAKDKAPVAKKAAPAAPMLRKAQSAMNVSASKMDKASPHKQSAPCLGGSVLSTPEDLQALKESQMAGTKRKSASVQELKRRSVAESIAEDIKEIKEEEEPHYENGPGKELF